MNIKDRFLNYVAYHTTSDEDSNTVPSTEIQKMFGNVLVEEMKGFGIQDAYMDDKGYVYGTIPAAKGFESAEVIGLIAHMDTSPSMSGDNVKPRVVTNYDGGDILLNEEKNIVMLQKEFSHLQNYVGQDLIVTDGTTLLGADDKAGVAEIMTLAELLLLEGSNIKHGKIRIGFTPDEEVGRGADYFDVENFGAAYAYTVDGGKLGEVEYENFNGAKAAITVNGVNIHPGEAKNKMKNSLLIGMEFHNMLPVFENPANTEGYEGFSHLQYMNGNEEKSTLSYIIRDHDKNKFEKKKERFSAIAEYLNEKYGKDTIVLSITDSYYNMKEKVEPQFHIVEKAIKAMEDAGVKPLVNPIRGATDGAKLSFMGLPCPNLSTGGHNFHGKFEYISVQSMEKMVEVLKNLVKAEVL